MTAPIAALAATPLLLAGTPAAADEEPRPAASATATPAPHASPGAARGRTTATPATGLAVALTGVPAEFHPGGDWEEFGLVLDNTTGKELDGYTSLITMAVNTIHPAPGLTSSLMRLQMRVGGTWLDADLRMDGRERDVDAELPFQGVMVAPGKTTYPVRLRFTEDAPLTEFQLGPRPERTINIGPEDYWEESEIVAAKDPGEEPSQEPSHEPSGEPSTEPSQEPGTEPSQEPSGTPSREPGPGPGEDAGKEERPGTGGPSGAPSGGTGGGSDASGEGAVPPPADTAGPGASGTSGALARTGAGASANWALGIGGGAVALGLACLAGVAALRHRRRV